MALNTSKFTYLTPLRFKGLIIAITIVVLTVVITVRTQFKRQCKGQAYKTAEIILQCHKVMCLYALNPFKM